MSDDEGPAEIMVTEFAHRLAQTLCSEIGRGETTALDVLDAMGTPELVDVFSALTVDIMAEVRKRHRRYNPVDDPEDSGLALAHTVLSYVFHRDVEGITTALEQAKRGSRRLAAVRLIMWNRLLWDGQLDL